jgi:YggT family protein
VSAISQVIYFVLRVFEFVLLARVLLSWFPNVDRSNPIIQFLYDITEPVLRPIRDMLPQNGMFDLSPLIAFLIIQVIAAILPTFLR